LPVKFEFELEFLTPAFIGGGDPTQTDFTLKALKGAVRYWWRQFQDTHDSRQLFERESKLFGSTRSASPVSMRMQQNSITLSQHPFRPSNQPGIEYLFYTCRERIQWIEVPSSVKFSLSFRSCDEICIRECLLALWMVTTFGWLGTRSRRGAGSFELNLEETSGLGAEVADLFEKQASDLLGVLKGTGSPNPFFELVHRESPLKRAMTKPNRFKVYEPGGDADRVLDGIGKKLKGWRQCLTYNSTSSDRIHKAARALHQAGKAGFYTPGPKTLAKTAFGLPVVYVFKQRDSETNKILLHQTSPKQGKIKFEPWKVVLEPTEHKRRASPLFISIKRKPGNDECIANLLILWGAFLTKGETVQIIKTQKINGQTVRTSIGTVAAPGLDELTNFIGSL
jgi:CRISPR type III-B/RAMP module RAMP protein Cmr1